LISELLEEQKIKRKAELDILQAQIKPHFLYNTLETIRSFALTGKTKEVNIVLKALGSYYRNSLSKGKEVISLREEIDIVRNYLTIQSMRYNELFDVQIDIDPATEDCNMLKLSIQPFVENAIYHGIKLSDRYGHISISTERIPGYVRIVVEDNGAGMTEETLDRITHAPSLEVSGSFGIRSTIERLNIFYGSDSIVQLSSEEGIGTKVSLLIPHLEVQHRDEQ
jgi:two-component system sensor histidine kinase YesM